MSGYPRGSAASRGYDSRWRKARALSLPRHPLCRMFEQVGRITPATVVDHIKPHKGDQALFWDEANWAALCAQHHNSTKQRIEKRGHEIGCTVDGVPLDKGHHWNR